MRTMYRIATTAVAVAAVFPFGMTAASADSSEPVVTQGAWYWAEQSVTVGPEALQPPTQLSGVPDKDLAVAYKGDADGAPDKVTYLAWDVSGIPAGSTIAKFEFTMTLSTEPQAVQATPPEYQLIACGAVGDFEAVAGGAFEGKPADDCSAQVPGIFDATKKTWTFDVAPYVQMWSDGDPPSGIAILPAKDSAEPFQVVFQPAATVKTSAEYTPPVPVASPTVEPSAPVQQPPVDNIAPPVVVQPPATVAPAPTPKPVVALPSRPITPAARSGLTWPKKSGLPGAFWAGALAAVALFGIASLVLGDATVAVERRRGTTLTRSLRERQAHRAPPARSQVRTV